MNKNKFGKRLFKRLVIPGILTFGLFAAMPISSKSKPPDYYYWGAIAYSFSKGVSGASWDYSTKNEAANGAIRSCGQSDCRVLLTFESECGAVAVGEKGWGSGYGESHNSAKNAAMSSCRGYGKQTACRVVESVCTTMEDYDNP